MKKRTKIGKRIKRTFIFLLILAAAGAVIYYGYLQFQLPADNYGVIFTKYTGDGWNPEVIKPASFRMEWEGMIPTNLSIERFTLLPVTGRVSAIGSLPSSDIYGMYLEGRPDFNYSYIFDMSYTVKPDSLPKLVSEEFLREETYESWLGSLESALSAEAAGFIRRKADDLDYMKRISYDFRLMEADIVKELSKEYSYLEIISFTPIEIVFPDLALYAEGRRQYFEVERYKDDIQKASLKETENKIVEETAKLELLEKYGAIFAKYPQLIDYYKINQTDAKGIIPYIELPESGSTETSSSIQQ